MNYRSKTNGWKEGVAFVRGINIYGNFRITKEKMLDLCNLNLPVSRLKGDIGKANTSL